MRTQRLPKNVQLLDAGIGQRTAKGWTSLSGTLTAELSHPWLSDSTGICAMHVCAHVSVQNHYPQAKAFRLPFPAFVLQTRVVILR
jgi:hypothetical protein